MKNKILLIVFSIVITGCFKDAPWDAGPEKTRKIGLDNYHTVELNGIFDILLVQDTLNYFSITCGNNLFPDFSYFQNEGVLHLSQVSGMGLTRNYKHTFLELHFKSLSAIQINNSVKIDTKLTIQSPGFSIQDNGHLSELNLKIDCIDFNLVVSDLNFGIFKISGTATNSYLMLKGSAHFRTENLVSDSCYIDHAGIGDCYVGTKRILAGTISRKGSLFYRYDPYLKVSVENINGRIFQIRD